ncbi:class I SAM-dependent methyltransferase [Arthrobacter zhangbolii]|uniref:Class I SAM-dependent methyltransferase n=1 Tax=Arthrobacter zhangbolii TaxID=2886936 RepID=A0A9X1M7J6_9MICC|nr:class I SAM-dependent methyltransferase [Arthrobacter zhangbolii]MCC3271759.1 class I SAM-dependent methyltransferase [Arthrobacter zhangbolii]UON93414.1 class I SAM-dependent methyltransferase [Arthrobacter zhangbolii]
MLNHDQAGMPADFFRAWNQGLHPDLYEIENPALDREGLVWAALARLAPWAGRVILDLGCGTGFWLPRYAELAASVIGVEPDPELLAAARARPGGASVLQGSAEHIPLPDHSVDLVHARFAYFFPSPQNDCSAGLAEVQRVLRPGGSLVVIDNDQHDGEFAELLEAANASAGQGDGGGRPAVHQRTRDEQLDLRQRTGPGRRRADGIPQRCRGGLAGRRPGTRPAQLRLRAAPSEEALNVPGGWYRTFVKPGSRPAPLQSVP